jgi:hypothetical protein
MQTLLVFGILLLIMGYFQYRRSRDVVAIIQEMFRPAYLVPAAIGAVAYLVVKVVASVLDKVL